MKLDRVTITGADDSVKPSELIALSRQFPFVEWGILFGSHPQTPRFPSDKWVVELCERTVPQKRAIRLSAHLCGRWVRDWVGQASPTWRLSYGGFQRIQFNFHGQFHRAAPGFLATLTDEKEYIFQVDGVNDHAVEWPRREGVINTVPLFDTSGGAGILPDGWPAPNGLYCGYAGGLGPDNLKEQIPAIGKAAGDARFWIDMETRV